MRANRLLCTCCVFEPTKGLGDAPQGRLFDERPADWPVVPGTKRRYILHDDPQAGHLALPPARRGPDVGLHHPQHCPLRTSKCATIRCSIRAPLGCRTRRILDEEMHHVCPHRQWQDRTEPGGQEIIPGRPSLPGDRQDLGGVPWVRRRSHQATETRRRRCARQQAVADDGGGKGQGQDRIDHAGRADH